MISRRQWLAAAVTPLAAVRGVAGATPFSGLAIAPRERVQEAILNRLDDGRHWLLFGENKRLVGKFSHDGGRTWGPVSTVVEKGGAPIPTGRDNVHLSLLQLKSGRLGMVYGGPYSRPGRDGTLHFRSSDDGGATWSPSTVIDPIFSVCRTAGARVLESGRIVAPVFNWYSAAAGGESEQSSHSICVSWVFYSDDEGRTWQRSLSELFVSLDEGRAGCYSFEEPSLVEREDGSLLMFGRTELGRFYQSVSIDGGVRWTNPEPAPLAASYTPPMLVRMPGSPDILLVWNQASAEEIKAGLPRHRLSTAISKDGGATWIHFRNLESMDGRARIDPPENAQVLRPAQGWGRGAFVFGAGPGYRQPEDRARYPRSPGCLRICYPTVAFSGGEVAIAYDYGLGVGEFTDRHATRIQVLDRAWLYGS